MAVPKKQRRIAPQSSSDSEDINSEDENNEEMVIVLHCN